MVIRAADTPPTTPTLPSGKQPHGCTPLVARYDGPGWYDPHSPTRPQLRARPLSCVLEDVAIEAELSPHILRLGES